MPELVALLVDHAAIVPADQCDTMVDVVPFKPSENPRFIELRVRQGLLKDSSRIRLKFWGRKESNTNWPVLAERLLKFIIFRRARLHKSNRHSGRNEAPAFSLVYPGDAFADAISRHVRSVGFRGGSRLY